jgi:hypothetical protein
MFARHVLRPEGVVENEDSDSRGSAIQQDAAQSVRHGSRLPVVRLNGDGAPGGSQVIPQAAIGAVPVQGNFDAIARGDPNVGEQSDTQREFGFVHCQRGAVRAHALHVADSGSPRQMEKSRPREQQDGDDERPLPGAGDGAPEACPPLLPGDHERSRAYMVETCARTVHPRIDLKIIVARRPGSACGRLVTMMCVEPAKLPSGLCSPLDRDEPGSSRRAITICRFGCSNQESRTWVRMFRKFL